MTGMAVPPHMTESNIRFERSPTVAFLVFNEYTSGR